MFDYVYFYPKDYGAPSNIAKSIFESLMQKELPYRLAVFPANNKIASQLKENYPNIHIVSLKQIFLCKNSLTIHIPVSPIFFPNRKFLLYIASMLRKNRLIINYHGEPRSEYKIRFKNHQIKEILLSLPTYLMTPIFIRSADIIVLNSSSMESIFKSIYSCKRIEVIPNALQNSWYNITNLPLLNLKKRGMSLFYHGRLSPEKGVDILLKALYLFLKEHEPLHPPLTVYIAGEGEQQKKLEKLASDLSIQDNVVFLGKLPLAELKSYLISVNAAIYPSVYEPFSMAVLESFALVNGPVLYSKNIGLNGFVQERGFEFYTFSPTVDGITKILEDLFQMKCPLDIHLVQKSFSSEFTWDKIINEYINLCRT